jgi:hypothetical protein
VPKREVNAVTLVIVLIAAGLSGTILPDRSIFAQPLVGVVLLIILFSFDRDGYRDMGQSLGFAATAGYCATRVVLPFLIFLVLGSSGTLPWFSIVWIVATLIFWAIDISRMQKRAAVPVYNAGQVTPQMVPVAPPTAVREEPVRVSTPVPPPAPARQSNVTSLFSQPSILQTPQPRPAVTEEMAAPPPPPAPVIPVTPQAPPPQAVPVPRGSGKPVTIYLNLVGEGLAVLRTVQAEHLGKDYYLIVEPMPPGENWEFQTGQVVRCQKRNLSSGKGLVAVEEAPRAF